MNTNIILNLLAVISATTSVVAIGITIYFGSFDIYSLSSPITLLIAAVLLYLRNKVAIIFLAISAIMYLLGGIVLAESYQISVFQLRTEFFISIIVRVLGVILAAYVLLSSKHNLGANKRFNQDAP